MAKATEAQIKQTRDALADPQHTEFPSGVRINFGDPEPIQTVSTARDGIPPSLGGKTRAELEAIAADEGVDISGAGTNAEIATAIEAAREQK